MPARAETVLRTRLAAVVAAVVLAAGACGSDAAPGLAEASDVDDAHAMTALVDPATATAGDGGGDDGSVDEAASEVAGTARGTEGTRGERSAGSDDGALDGGPLDDGPFDDGDTGAEQAAPASPGQIVQMVPELVATYPHDNTAYTQGLEVFEGQLVESTGRGAHRDPSGQRSELVHESDVRVVDIESGDTLAVIDAPGTVFGEGLTRVGDEFVQITWQDGRAFYWDVETFELRREFNYDGAGWGLCFDGDRLVMTDGSDKLFFRDPATFEVIGQVSVTASGQPLGQVNELECVGDYVWGNVYRTDLVVRIDPTTGVVDGVVDASSLEQPRTAPTEVLNGIAWDAATETWLMTGKFWPTTYRVRFVPAEPPG